MGIGILMIAYTLFQFATTIPDVDASQDHRAELFGQEVLSITPQNALIFAKGDKAVFTLWYFHFALRQRTDLIVLAPELLQYDWYQEVVRSAYPLLSMPASLPYPEAIIRINSQRPVCNVQFTDHTELACTSKP
jgi:hypothetical protein